MTYSSNESDSDDDPNPTFIAAQGPPSETVLLINRQRTLHADWKRVEAFLRDLYSKLAAAPFSVCLVSDRTMRRYNRQFRHQDHATDVLSFPADGHRAGLPAYLGDIVISVETARDNAAEYGIALEEEMKMLALHGVLHLMGYDHETDHGQMARAEKLWRVRLGLPGCLTARAPKPRASLVSAAGGRR